LSTFDVYADTSETMAVCSRQCWNFAGEAALNAPSGEEVWNTTTRSASGSGTGFRRTALMIEKIAVLAPIPSASAATAAMLKPGLCRNMRKE
jgi:hypothetical protein